MAEDRKPQMLARRNRTGSLVRIPVDLVPRHLRPAMAFTLAACFVIAAGGTVMAHRAVFGSDSDRNSSALDRTIANKAARPLAEKRQAAVTEALRSLARRPQVVAACVYSVEGELFAYYRRNVEFPPCERHPGPGPNPALVNIRRVSQPVVLSGTSVGSLEIVSDYNLNPPGPDSQLRVFGAAVLAITLASLAVAFAAGSRLAAPIAAGESVLRKTLDAVRDAVLMVDVQGRIVFANEPALALTHKTSEQIHGCRLVELVRPASHTIADRLLADSGVTALLTVGEDSGMAVEMTSSPMPNGTVVVLRKRLVEGHASEMLEALSRQPDIAVIGYDVNGAISDWGSGAERTFGYSFGEIAGKPSSALIVGDETDFVAEALQRLPRNQPVQGCRSRLCTKSGVAIEADVTISPLFDSTGRLAGLLQIARDLTAQNEAASRLQALTLSLEQCSDRLKRSNQDLEWFAFVASHDLQEPLRMISLNSQFLARETCGADEQGTVFVRNIMAGTLRMRKLLEDLLAYTEVGSSECGADQAGVDLNYLLPKVQANLEELIKETGATIMVPYLPTIHATETHATALFQNLLENSLRYRGEETPRITVTAIPAGQHIQFEVADNGIGIDPEYHERIFMPFKRLHGRNIPGTGIGLAICQRVVQRYGGSIRVNSKAGSGATFVFTMPPAIRGGVSAPAGGHC